VPEAWDVGSDAEQLESRVRRDGRIRCEAAERVEDENAKLKKLLAEWMLDALALRALLGKNSKACRQAHGCTPSAKAYKPPRP
jgi:hypothetical protein